MARFTCPFCMSQYDKKEVQYFCPQCNAPSVPRFLEREPIKCQKGCGGYATDRRCPKCGRSLPKESLETPNLPFSIVGVSNSGKTNYITVMLHELGRAPGLRLALGAQTKYTRDHQNENYSGLTEHHLPPEGTNSGEPEPQIWYIKNQGKRHGNIVPTYTFTIFDGAGEDHENMDPSSSVCRYINASEAIILTLDPLILQNIRLGNVVDPRALRNSRNGGGRDGERNAVDVVNSVASYIKSARGIRANRMLDIPVAVVLTKFDTILDHGSFAPTALIKQKSRIIDQQHFNKTEMQQVSQEIRDWLYEIGEGSFIDALESQFKEFYFFGVSSFGSAPDERNRLTGELRPHRVLDPIMWLFNKKGFID